jgi:hypothetical protein
MQPVMLRTATRRSAIAASVAKLPIYRTKLLEFEVSSAMTEMLHDKLAKIEKGERELLSHFFGNLKVSADLYIYFNWHCL